VEFWGGVRSGVEFNLFLGIGSFFILDRGIFLHRNNNYFEKFL
jgi:hypothetical protein